MRRREFIAGLGSAAVWPVAVSAQQPDRMRQIGVLLAVGESDAEGLTWKTAFALRLQELGWMEGRNLTIHYRFGTAGVNRMPDLATELIALQPDVILAGQTTALLALLQSTFSIPIVFAQVADPIEIGLVTSLAHPGGNITGFTTFEPTIGGKWLHALKDISPGISRVALLFDLDNPSWVVYARALEAAAPALGMRLTPAGVRDAAAIERVMETFARDGGAGLVVVPSPVTINNRDSIIALAARRRLPTVYPYRFFAAAGGLLSYGVDVTDLYRRRGNVYRPHTPGRKSWRSSGSGADQVRASDQHEGCQVAWARRSRGLARHCRRGDSMRRREFIAGLGSAAADKPAITSALRSAAIRRESGICVGTKPMTRLTIEIKAR
jgi:putative ABC transport system substrate-binding protein